MGNYLILKAIERELRVYKGLQLTKGVAHKDTMKQAMVVDSLLNIGGMR